MSSKKHSYIERSKAQGVLNLAQKSFILDHLREKYSRRSSVTPFDERKIDRASPSLQTSENGRDSAGPGNPQMFLKKPSFRDVVLRAARHKPFLENLSEKSKRRLSDLGHQARLDKFRQVASRWKAKTKKKSDIISETLPEVEVEIIIPEKPRFCATLSTEAQYAIFKGYEDVLVQEISASLPSSKGSVPIKRVPSASAKPKASSEKSPFTILENKPKIVLVSSLKERENNVDKSPERSGWKRDHDLRYMSAHFKQAMNLLDELKRNSYIEPETQDENVPKSEDNAITMEKSIKQYHAWSQRWAKHFDFTC